MIMVGIGTLLNDDPQLNCMSPLSLLTSEPVIFDVLTQPLANLRSDTAIGAFVFSTNSDYSGQLIKNSARLQSHQECQKRHRTLSCDIRTEATKH
jgi:hypothetical protein